MADTIAAISTAPIKSAIGVIRISGDNALEISERVFCGALRKKPREMVTGNLLDASGSVCDFGMGVYFNAPKSFTGEDTVELNCHGSVAVLSAVLEALFAAGARHARPGEFTERAFLNGKIDLTGAEAIIDLIDAETEAAAKNAAEQMNGVIGREISEISQSLVSIAAEFYAFVDYPDEEITESSRESILETLSLKGERAQALSESYKQGQIIKSGVSVALLGCPNVGKSSLTNRLLKTERSIVTDIPGTTRDTIEESFTLSGLAVRIIDTAGVRESSDEVEKLGIERTKKAAEASNLRIAIFDNSRPVSADDLTVLNLAKQGPCLCVINKCDLPKLFDDSILEGLPTVKISAKNNIGTDALLEKIAELFRFSEIVCDGKTVTNPRHASTLKRAADFIFAARDALICGMTPDVCVADIENAINTLGELSGKTAADEVVSEIFSRFCVGK